MGFVLVISLPFIILVAILAIGCYLLGRASRSPRLPQYYGPPAPPVVGHPPPPPPAQK